MRGKAAPPADPELPRSRGHTEAPAWRSDAAAIAGYVVLTIVMTYPIAFRLGSAIPGDGTDCWAHYWNLWWVHRALLVLHVNPFATSEVYHPVGASLLFHSLALVHALLALPLVDIFGLSVGYDVVTLLSFVGSGWAGYRLFLEISPLGEESRLAAFLCGSVFAFSAFRFMHLLGHLDLLGTPFMPAYALALVRIFKGPGIANVVGAAVWLALTALAAWYLWMHLMALTAVVALHHAACGPRSQELGRAEFRAASVVALATVLLAPLLVPMVEIGPAFGALPPSASLSTSADLLAFFVPSSLHPLWGRALGPLWSSLVRDGNRTEGIVFLGLVPLALACFAERGADRRLWTVVLIAFCVLALGPVLHVAGRTPEIAGAPVPLPYAMLTASGVPFGSVVRAPSRFVSVATLALGVLAGLGARRLFATTERPALAFAALLFLGLFEQAAVPYPTAEVRHSPLYDRLRLEPRTAVLEIPIPDDPAWTPRRMLYQTVHEKPVYGGYLSRGLPPLSLRDVPGMAPWKTLPPNPAHAFDGDIVPGGTTRTMTTAALALYDTGFVVLDKSITTRAERVAAEALLSAAFAGDAPYFEDASVIAYRVPAPSTLPDLQLTLAEGWYPLESGRAPDGSRPHWRWMIDRARIGVVAPRAARLRIVLRTIAIAPKRTAITLDAQPIGEIRVTSELRESSVGPIDVSPGVHSLWIDDLDGAEEVAGRKLGVALHAVRVEDAAEAARAG